MPAVIRFALFFQKRRISEKISLEHSPSCRQHDGDEHPRQDDEGDFKTAGQALSRQDKCSDRTRETEDKSQEPDEWRESGEETIIDRCFGTDRYRIGRRSIGRILLSFIREPRITAALA